METLPKALGELCLLAASTVVAIFVSLNNLRSKPDKLIQASTTPGAGGCQATTSQDAGSSAKNQAEA